MKECRTLVLGNQSSGTAPAPVPPDRASGPSRACLCAISDRDWVISIPENGRVAWLTGKKNGIEKPTVNPEYEQTNKAITFRDKVKEEIVKTRPGGGGKRGDVCGFSARSRLRLMKAMGSINYEVAGLPVFLTSTYGEWIPDSDEWKRNLAVFTKALRRKWPEVWGCWKLEFQKRGAPHFHFLLWGGPTVKGCRVPYGNGKWAMKPYGRKKCPENGPVFDWLEEHWGKVYGFTRIEPVATIQGVMAYTGKYLGKVYNEETMCRTGRVWGVINRKAWKKNVEEYSVDNTEAFRFRRVARKWTERANGYRMKKKSTVQGITVFMRSETAERLRVWACEGRNGCPF